MSTGFLEFKPRLDPILQGKYDPMSSSWEGEKSSDKAVAKGLYELDVIVPSNIPKIQDPAYPTNTSDKDINLKPMSKPLTSLSAEFVPPPKAISNSCSIQ